MIVEEKISVTERSVSCSGGGSTGHPKVYLEIGSDNNVECPYCGKKFIFIEEER
jgi:uncharacterized Zn-finger protein